MDAFFAAVEVLDRPELAGRPVVVGAPPDRRGVVATASYEARRFGIHSAMPSREAGRRCPEAVFLPPRMKRYEEMSGRVFRVFESFTPQVEPLSVDEAFLDVRGALYPFGGCALNLARALKIRMREETGLTASVGVATNKFLAKLASDLEKPDGLVAVPTAPDEIRAFLAPLPVGRIWGVGTVAAARLQERGVRTIGDLQQVGEGWLTALLGRSLALHALRLAAGEDSREVAPESERKSLSREHTFDEDEADPDLQRRTLVGLAEDVGRRLRAKGLEGRVVTLKVRMADFRTLTRRRTLDRPLREDRALIREVLALWEASGGSGRSVRLLGCGVEGLADAGSGVVQPGLFEKEGTKQTERDRRLDAAVDRLRARYGFAALRRGGGPHGRHEPRSGS